MRRAQVCMHGEPAGILTEADDGKTYELVYVGGYSGPPISLTMPVSTQPYTYTAFPPFFDGLLPEGPQLEALLRRAKLDRYDYFGQLVTVGRDLVGAVTVKPLP